MLSDERDLGAAARLRCADHRLIVRVPGVKPTLTTNVVALTTPIDDLDTDDEIDAWLRANVTDYVHAVGTCRMGAADDPAVGRSHRSVRARLRRAAPVRRPVMPDLPKANRISATVAIAERLVFDHARVDAFEAGRDLAVLADRDQVHTVEGARLADRFDEIAREAIPAFGSRSIAASHASGTASCWMSAPILRAIATLGTTITPA